MKRVKVLIPFHLAKTGTNHVKDDVIKVDTDTLARLRAINPNMVLVLGDVTEKVEKPSPKPKPKKSTKKD